MLQTFSGLTEKPLLVDLTIEEGQRLKVIYGSNHGFHAIDLDTSQVFDVYIPAHVGTITSLLLCHFYYECILFRRSDAFERHFIYCSFL